MAKKQSSKEQPKAAAAPAPAAKQSFKLNRNSIFPLLGCFLYLMVHFVEDWGAYDAMGSQWMYMVGVDMLVILYILARKDLYAVTVARLLNNIFSKLYLAFFALAGISIFMAINPTEGWVTYVRMITTVIAFFNIAILLQGRVDLFKVLAQTMGIILFVESCQTISQFIEGYSTTTLTELIRGLKGTAGNKNIFAAGLVIKIPFVMYCLHRFKLVGKILNMIILLVAAVAIFLVNARASYLSLVLVSLLYIIFSILEHRKEKKLETTLFRIGCVLVPLVIAFFVQQTELGQGSGVQEESVNFGSATERFASMTKTDDESNQVRFRLWAHAIDYTKHHPLMGCGIGNWKIASIVYQRTITNDLYVPIHSHNDFLEVFAELGILGGLLYLSLFICLAVLVYKTYYSKADEELKLVSVFSLIAFSTYAVDAMFNFPLERPISQVFFAIVTAIIVGTYIKSREELGDEKVVSQKPGNFKIIYSFIAILLLIPSFYVTYQTYKSLILQKTVLGDLNNEPLRLNYKDIMAGFPSIPNLSATAQPIEAIKGRYMYEAGKYDEALVLLDKGREANPVIGYSEFLKAGLYYKKDIADPGKHFIDSAFRNGMVAFYLRPKAKTYYQTLVAVLARKKDTANLQKVFKEYDTYRHHTYGWNYYLLGMENAEVNLGKVNPHLLRMADSGLAIFPGDSDLIVRRREIANAVLATNSAPADVTKRNDAVKYYQQGVAAFGTGVKGKDDMEKAAGFFLKSHALNPGDISSLENAAICYFNLGQYQKAIPYFDQELATKLSTNGKPEYFKAIALINLGKKEEGCSLMQVASTKKYPGADLILKNNCGK
ncbi:MAG: O-antigen ligase family protein [Bacteroidota bacterium]